MSLLISLQIISPNIHEKWYYYYLIFSFEKKIYFSILLAYFVLLIWFVVTIEKCFGERNNIISTYGPWLVTSWQGQIFTTFFIECLLNFLISIFNAAYLVERLHFWVSDSKKSILFCSGLLLDHSSQFKNWCMTKNSIKNSSNFPNENALKIWEISLLRNQLMDDSALILFFFISCYFLFSYMSRGKKQRQMKNEKKKKHVLGFYIPIVLLSQAQTLKLWGVHC